MSSPLRAAWVAIALFALAVTFLGGSSRPDMVQLIALQPLAFLFLIPALYALSPAELRDYKPILIMLLLLTAWSVVQLIPLPPDVWNALPSRSAIAALDQQIGLGNVWRPISMSPTLGWASAAGFAIPIAALLLAAAFKLKRLDLLALVAGIGALNILLSFLQVAAGGGDALRLYRINNRGGPTGIFANENHSGVFLAIVLLVVARLILLASEQKRPRSLVLVLWGLLGMAFLAILVHGSRAGIVLGLASALAALAMFWKELPQMMGSRKAKNSRTSRRQSKLPQFSPRYIFGAIAAALIGLIALFLSLDRIPGFADISTGGPVDDLRWQLFGPLTEMMRQFWVLGSGFGSFADAYKIFEPVDLARPAYLNNAHNDFLQLIIEGGIPAVLIAVALIAFLARGLFGIIRAQGLLSAVPIFWIAVFMAVAAASVVDYPVRTPIFQASLIWLLCVFTLDAKAASHRATAERTRDAEHA